MASSAGKDDLTAPVRAYLDGELPAADAAFCFRWLAACALYPALRWQVTAALGEALAAADGRSAPDEDLFLALGRLPWFRTGRMPEELRRVLVRTLSRADRKVAQATLTRMFASALEISHASAGDGRALGARLGRLIERLPDAELADPLLAAGLRGRRPAARPYRLGELRWRLPARARDWLQAPRVAALAALAAAVVVALLAAPLLRQWMAGSGGTESMSVEIAYVTLAACSGDPGEGAEPTFPVGTALAMQRPLRMERVIPGRGFQSAVVSPDASTAVTEDERGGRVIWSLLGGGAIGGAPGNPLVGVYNFGAGPFGMVGGSRDIFGLTDQNADLATSPLPDRQPAAPVADILTGIGQTLQASVEGRDVVLRRPGERAIVQRISGAGSPLLGVSTTGDMHLVVGRCDPAGRITPAGLQTTIAEKREAPVEPRPKLEPKREPVKPDIRNVKDAMAPYGETVSGPVSTEQQTIRPGETDGPAPSDGTCGGTFRFKVEENLLVCADGSPIIQVPGAGTRGRGPITRVQAILFHSSGTPAGGANAASLNIITNGRPDLAGPLAHLLVGRNGAVYQVAAFNLRAQHAGQTDVAWRGVKVANSNSIAVEAENSGRADDPISFEQMAALTGVARALAEAYNVQAVVGHKEVSPRRNLDPPFDVRQLRRAIGVPLDNNTGSKGDAAAY